MTSEDKDLARQLAFDKLNNKTIEQEYFETWSFYMFLLAKETGYIIDENTNMVIVFDMIDNLQSYINFKGEESNKTLNHGD